MTNPFHTYALMLAVALLLAIWAAVGGGVLEFLPTTSEDVWNILTPLILIALFVERAVEVLISSWRSMNRAELEANVEYAKQNEDTPEKIQELERLVREYRSETLIYAFMASAGISLFISICGVRVLEPLTDIELAAQLWGEQDVGYGLQSIGFRTVDIFVTAGMLAGGANGIHKVLMLFLDFIDRTRERIPKPA